MSVALKKIDGVESAEVRLNEGKAIIRLKPNNAVRMEQIRKAVTDQGFTPKEARVVAVADLTVSDGKIRVKITGSNDLFPADPAPDGVLKEKAGQNLLVTGIVAAPQDAKEIGVMQVLQATKESSTPKQP